MVPATFPVRPGARRTEAWGSAAPSAIGYPDLIRSFAFRKASLISLWALTAQEAPWALVGLGGDAGCHRASPTVRSPPDGAGCSPHANLPKVDTARPPPPNSGCRPQEEEEGGTLAPSGRRGHFAAMFKQRPAGTQCVGAAQRWARGRTGRGLVRRGGRRTPGAAGTEVKLRATGRAGSPRSPPGAVGAQPRSPRLSTEGLGPVVTASLSLCGGLLTTESRG